MVGETPSKEEIMLASAAVESRLLCLSTPAARIAPSLTAGLAVVEAEVIDATAGLSVVNDGDANGLDETACETKGVAVVISGGNAPGVVSAAGGAVGAAVGSTTSGGLK